MLAPEQELVDPPHPAPHLGHHLAVIVCTWLRGHQVKSLLLNISIEHIVPSPSIVDKDLLECRRIPHLPGVEGSLSKFRADRSDCVLAWFHHRHVFEVLEYGMFGTDLVSWGEVVAIEVATNHLPY